MSEPFIAEIRIFAGNFAPRGWALCDGQLLPIAQNTALFSLVGTIYGGDGRTDFALPDLRGRAAMHAGSGPGLSPRQLGQSGGAATVTLTHAQLPGHSHSMSASPNPSESPNPAGNALGRSVGGSAYGDATNLVPLADAAAAEEGGNQSHNNMQPFLTVNFIIALVGLFPPRN